MKSVKADSTHEIANDTRDYREMPHNNEAEQGLLGMLLVNNEAVNDIADFLQAEHFYQPVHGKIYEAITTLVNRGQQANPVTLKNYFEKEEELTPVGGTKYLEELASEAPLLNNQNDYARTIHERFLSRRLISTCQDTASKAFEFNIEVKPVDLIEELETGLFSLAESGISHRGYHTFKDSMHAAMQLAEKAYQSDGAVSGIPTGLADLDKQLGGLNDTDLIILAGRPSMGKTALASNIAFNAAEAYLTSDGRFGGKVGFFSLEMGYAQIATRILGSLSGIPSDQVRKGNISKDDFRKFIQGSEPYGDLPLYIDDTPALSISALKTRARRMKRKHDINFIVIDYLQLLSGSKRISENRTQEISEITRGLKAIAKDLNIPVLALSQLSREVEKRDDKRPQLSDLRESGSIEQDADIVMFVYRNEYYLSREEPSQKATETSEKFQERQENWQDALDASKHMAEVIIAKHRHGSIGTTKLFFDPNFTKFTDLAR